MLAWRMYREKRCRDSTPTRWCAARPPHSSCSAHDPARALGRYEGYSPSTLASNIAALVCAAAFASLRGEAALSQFLLEYADFLESHLEAWTVTTAGSLVPPASTVTTCASCQRRSRAMGGGRAPRVSPALPQADGNPTRCRSSSATELAQIISGDCPLTRGTCWTVGFSNFVRYAHSQADDHDHRRFATGPRRPPGRSQGGFQPGPPEVGVPAGIATTRTATATTPTAARSTARAAAAPGRS